VRRCKPDNSPEDDVCKGKEKEEKIKVKHEKVSKKMDDEK
jgi:hypothetical protein